MSLENALEDYPFDYNDPALSTMDYRFTQNSHHAFSQKCSQKLAQHAIKGRGYFIEADEEHLRTLMDRAADDEDWVSVANYAMMLDTKRQYNKEREAWERTNGIKPYTPDDMLG